MTKYVLSIRRGADGDVALGHGRSCDLGHNGGTGEEGGHGGLGVSREGGAGKNNNLTWPLDEKKTLGNLEVPRRQARKDDVSRPHVPNRHTLRSRPKDSWFP